MANFLEQLVTEWYEYRGYFVRQNIWVGKRPRGGYDCELDVVAFHPANAHLVHIEPSMDADSWAERQTKYRRKFTAGRKHIPKLFEGFELPEQIEQIALLVFASTRNRTTVGGGTILIVDDFLEEILTELDGIKLDKRAVPERWPILRSLQFVSHFRDVALRTWAQNAQ